VRSVNFILQADDHDGKAAHAKTNIVTRQRQASGFVAARLGSDMVVGTYVGKEVGV
jgi:hypothetical protein